MPMHRFRFVLPASLLIGCATASATTFAGDDIQRIAHAGGGYRSWQYTNSLEALDFNRDYFTLFEIDFSWTRDEKLVCLHDWKLNAERIFGQAFNQPATLAEFQRLVANNPYVHSCTLDSLRDWLVQHPDKRVVTDIKHHNLKGLARLAEQLGENASQRIIPQIYTPMSISRCVSSALKTSSGRFTATKATPRAFWSTPAGSTCMPSPCRAGWPKAGLRKRFPLKEFRPTCIPSTPSAKCADFAS